MSAAAKYNAADQLRYTATANTAACKATPSGGTSYTYNGSGDLTAATAGPVVAATYSAFDQTASTKTGTVTTAHSYSDISSDERTSSGSNQFTNGILGLTRQTSGSNAVEFLRDPFGAFVAMRTSSATSYVTADALGSVILLTDNVGSSVGLYVYDTWGNITNRASLTATAASNPIRFAGGYQDSSGLMKFGTRYYDPQIGRFIQADPSGSETNRYVYTGCNPVNATDPTGRNIFTCLASVLSTRCEKS